MIFANVGGANGYEGRDQDDPEDDGSDEQQLLGHGEFPLLGEDCRWDEMIISPADGVGYST